MNRIEIPRYGVCRPVRTTSSDAEIYSPLGWIPEREWDRLGLEACRAIATIQLYNRLERHGA